MNCSLIFLLKHSDPLHFHYLKGKTHNLAVVRLSFKIYLKKLMFCGRSKPLAGFVPIETVEDRKLVGILEISFRTLVKAFLRGTEVMLFEASPHGCVFSDSLLSALLFLFLCWDDSKLCDPGGTSSFFCVIEILNVISNRVHQFFCVGF